MKKLILVLIIFQSVIISAQIAVSKDQLRSILVAKNNKTYSGRIGLTKSYPISNSNSFAIITEKRNIDTNASIVYFDFGQESGFFEIDYIIDENGNKFQIFSAVDAMNYMKKLGWKYLGNKGYEYLQYSHHSLSKYIFENTGDAIVPIIENN